MSRTFGPLRQNGYVVPDIEAALQHFFEHIAKRAAAWDGSNPIRRMRPEPAAASEQE